MLGLHPRKPVHEVHECSRDPYPWGSTMEAESRMTGYYPAVADAGTRLPSARLALPEDPPCASRARLNARDNPSKSTGLET